jgi:peroxiredoxin
MQCRVLAGQLGRLHESFKAENCEILLILGDTIEKAKRYSESLHLPFPVLADPERNIYHLYGLEKTFIFIQRTASVVIDHQGIIRYLKTTSNPMIWLDESRELLKFVQGHSEAS